MPDNDKNLQKFEFRAALPRYIGYSAIVIIAVSLLIVTVGFIRERNRPAFMLLPQHTQLSTDVIAQVNGYERLESEGSQPKYYVKAEKATTFADNHQELENVYFEIYDEAGNAADKIEGSKALYVPEENKNFTAYLAGDVKIATRDRLNVQTDEVRYTKADELAVSDGPIQFERENVKGTAVGARIHVAEKKLELLKDVNIDTYESADSVKSNVRQANIKSSSAVFDQTKQSIEFHDNVTANIQTNKNGTAAAKTIDVTSNSANAILEKLDEDHDPILKQIELIDNVKITSVENGGKPTKIEAGYALYDKLADRFDLKNTMHIITVEDERPTDIKATSGSYDESRGTIDLVGEAEITQGADIVRGDSVSAQLHPNKKLKTAVSKGNAYLKQSANDRTTELSANELNASFAEDQDLQLANSVGESSVLMTPAGQAGYTRVTLSAPKAIHMWFKAAGAYDRMQTDGRTTIQLNVPDSTSNAANKKVTADSVRTFFDAAGKNLEKAEAIGNAELYVEPLHSSPDNYKTTVTAPRFDCDFYPNTNDAKSCVAATKTKAVRVPTAPDDTHGTQTITADRLTAGFDPKTKDVERIDATGSAKFTELDRNAISSQFSFTALDGTLRLRGNEPTVWDSKARAKAKEIDWDTKNQRSYLRGGVNTTYYSQAQTGGATPFSDSKKPVFITADNAEIDHRQEIGRYTGNARGWQESNYVRGDLFIIDQRKQTFEADGNVQSLIYNVKRKENGKETTTPIYAAARKMDYWRNGRLLKYENDVDIRQGSDRILAQSANVYLNDNNEVSRTVAEKSVVITQPGRRATGDHAEYDVAQDTVELRGNPATVDDKENGSSQASLITVNMRDNLIKSDGRANQSNAGRIRSVYKVKN